MSREPVAIANALKGLIVAVAPLGSLFGWWELSEQELAQITVAIIAIGEFLSTVFVRKRVTPSS